MAGGPGDCNCGRPARHTSRHRGRSASPEGRKTGKAGGSDIAEAGSGRAVSRHRPRVCASSFRPAPGRSEPRHGRPGGGRMRIAG
jgi:hypothetical protein